MGAAIAVFVAISAIAMLLQFFTLFGMYKTAKALQTKVDSLVPKVEALIPKVEGLIAVWQ